MIVDLGRTPRDVLARMAGPGMPVTVGRRRGRRAPAAAGPDRPGRRRLPLHGRDGRRPRRGVVERATRSSSCSSARRSPGSARARAARACPTSAPGSRTGPARSPEPFTARPGARQITLARGRRRRDRRRLPADAAPRRAPRARGADGPVRRLVAAVALRRRRAPSTGRSARASRSATSSTLGKLVVSGPDVVEALERIYPCHVADIKPGRSRYALLLNERGHVMDDGMILRESETRFVLTFTSGGAANAEMWLRDWIETWGLRVHVMDRTMSLAAINVTGPLAGELLRRARPRRPAALPGARPRRRSPACRATSMRLSFTGEAAWELHHPVDRLGRAVAGAHGRRRATSGSGRTGSRRCSGCGSRRATSSSAWTPSSTRRRAGSGWTGRPGWTSRGSSAGPRSSGRRSCRRRPPLGRVLDGRPGAGRGHADLRCRGPRGHRQRDGELALPAARQGADARLAAATAASRPRRRSTAARRS